jgi:hypothetical protein
MICFMEFRLSGISNENPAMKFLLFCTLFLFATQLSAQTPERKSMTGHLKQVCIPGDTLPAIRQPATAAVPADMPPISMRRSCYSNESYIYIDGIRVLIAEGTTISEEVSVITGGLPGTYGDVKSSIIRINQPEEIPAKPVE